MKISFNPSNSNKNILDLIKSNKDIIFDLKGHNIFARGVEFKGTDTNTWRPVVDNLTSDSTTSSLSAKQGKVLKALIDGKSDSEHNHDDRYLKLTGGTMAGTINRRSGGHTISGRDHAIIRQTYAPGGSSWNPIACVDTETGTWTLGHLSSGSSDTNFHFCFSTNADYNAGNNVGNYVTLRNRVGTIALTSEIPSKGSWNYDDRYYTKAESNAKYITDITTSVNKLTFTKNGANINKDITVNQILSKGALPNIADKDNTTKADSGLFIYSSYAQTIGTNLFSSVLSINTGGTIQIAGNWGDDQPRNLYWRSQSDRNVANYPWKSWRTILDNGNSSISGNTITINGNSLTVSKLDHNHDGRYVYNYGGIQMDGASVNKNALGMSTTSGITGDWWHILQAAWNGEYRWNSQIAFPTQNRNGMYYRSGLDDNTKWGSWIKLLDIGNSYVKDGKGIINGTTITQVDNSDKLDGYHASYSSSTPWGTIPVITTQGFMDIGKHLEFHHDNTTGSDYSTILMCTGNYSNIVDLPSESGTLALLSQVVSTSNFNWTNLPGKVVLGNEFNIVNAGYNNQLWFNYLPIDNRNSSAAISQYNMCNGNKGLASVYAYRFKADGKSCVWKDARNYAPFYATFNGGFEPILDIKTVSGDWSIGSYDSAGNYLIFSFTSDSDFNAGVNGTAWYYITTDGTFSGASRYINHTPGEPQSYMYSTSTGTYDGAIQIREVNGVLNNQSAWGYAPRITFHWGQRYAKGFGMRSDGQFAVDDVPIALTSNVLTFDNNANYLAANFNNPDFSKKAASTYIECWDGAGGWWNWMAGKFMKAGSSDAYVLLGGGGHKPLSEFSLNSSDYDNRYLKLTGGTMTGVIRFNNLINSASALVLDYKYSAGGFARDIVSMKNSVYGDADLGALSILCYPNSTSNGFQYIYLGTDKYDGTNNLRIYKDKVTFGNNILIDAGNIGSQRVAYATSAGSVSNSLNIFGVSYNGSAAKTVTTSTFVSQLSEGTSTVTDGTMFITSWASDSGFADTNAVNVPYKRKASCLWSYIDSKVSSKYLPLAGGTMNGNARIGHGSGNLYIGNSGNDGWIYTQDIASQSGTDKWWVRESGAAHFGNVYICAKSDYTTYDSSIIECYNDALYLNYYSSTKVILCKGGGSVGIGTVPSYKLDVKGQAQAQGFRHSNHNSDDAVLLAGGGYSQGVPVKYWSIETIIIYGPTQVSRTNRGGNYTFVTKVEPRINGSCTLTLQFPSGYNNYNTIIWAMGRLNQEAHDFSNSSIYATIVHLEGSKYYLNLADDESLNNGTCQLYFMCF